MSKRVAQTMDDLPEPGEITSISGLAFMQDVLAGRRPGPPIGHTLGFHVIDVAQGRVVFEGAPEFGGQNIMGATHGGWYGALLDTCMGCAIMTEMPKGSLYTTLEYKVNITRAVPLGKKVRAIGQVSHAGRTTAVATGELRGLEDNKLYATGSTTCLIMTM